MYSYLFFITLADVTAKSPETTLFNADTIMSLIGTIGVGSIIATILSYFLNHKSSITDVDIKKLNFYKYIAFSCIYDSFFEKRVCKQQTC
ncbi:hypothetical protein [Breznakia pachnodae]|uniref:Magnesium-transporting ATPase (P-type) n=1 Tax=Breznakia pachnodae TaxID=265178 RepID=A0ABU0E6F1_9FIRM|nr:hypothetical protein [Breznakia pachnodae]MDQ0362492.1 magnesium-transporting ATPase (P-type) [Breznakia pachnodae]